MWIISCSMILVMNQRIGRPACDDKEKRKRIAVLTTGRTGISHLAEAVQKYHVAMLRCIQAIYMENHSQCS
ncbi:unnamed protein product [Urochloa humidicola]